MNYLILQFYFWTTQYFIPFTVFQTEKETTNIVYSLLIEINTKQLLDK